MEEIKLMSLTSASGCGCKIAPDKLDEILKQNKISQKEFSNLIIGNSSNDDASVYDLGNNQSLVSTVDFFTPIVNNPYHYGQISACNAISDIYAMGGKPLVANAVLGWPIESLGTDLAANVIKGAVDICNKAKIPLAGGHSINSKEPFFGLAVNGIIHNSNIKANNAIKNKNALYLTKPIGTGIYSSALKRDVLTNEQYEQLINLSTGLNEIGTELGTKNYIHAMTDVTGFGLIGHLCEMIKNTGLSIILHKNKIPLLEGVKSFAEQFIFPNNTTRNYNTYSKFVEGFEELDFIYYCDPQTSGGLLISVDANYENEIETLLLKYHLPINKIGYVCNNNLEQIKLVNE
ncbi:MAG: selenide, water dikinase SelD [Bacteroidetes bacterium]|nr:selenide, water dikinase SelD [Bacteroidota bacterium]